MSLRLGEVLDYLVRIVYSLLMDVLDVCSDWFSVQIDVNWNTFCASANNRDIISICSIAN